MKKLSYLIFLFTILTSYSFSQEDLTYQTPHKDILQWADVKMPPGAMINDDADKLILLFSGRFKSIEELSQKELRLAGLRINPVTNIGSRINFRNEMTIFDPGKKKERSISGMPDNAKIASVSWSPTQKHIAFTNTTKSGVELWLVDVEKAKATRLTKDILNANMGRPFVWFRDGSGFLVQALPENRKELIDVANTIPRGPIVSSNDGAQAQNRTYQDLLKNKNDEYNFEQLSTSEIKKVDLSGNMSDWKSAGMHRWVSFSPNGEYVLISEIKRPFSYIVPLGRFPFTTTIYTASGKKVKEILNSPLEEERPKGFMSVQKGMRNIAWRNDKGATLYWMEALDDGDANNKVDYRDALYQLPAPFTGNKQELLKTIDRLGSVDWGNDQVAIATDYWWNTRNTRSYLFNPSKKGEVREIINRNYQDVYNDPGNPVSEKNKYGTYVLAINNNKILFEGRGISKEGTLPFIDEFDLKTQKTERLWRAKKGNNLERIIGVLDAKKGLILERIESKSEFPNYFIRNIRKGGEARQITQFDSPFENLASIHKEVITYKREDGLDLSATLYLPPGYDKSKKEKLPMLMWAYPREFKDKSSAGQVVTSSNQFSYIGYTSPLLWLNRGYVVLDNASFPIVGEGDEEPNDTFIEQLVSNGKAAIDAVDELGYIDRERVAVGGHSYGAFMTANLLTHSDLFAAGIARSGAYNRTLTPFGFQSEERSYWEAPEIYYQMSPFMHASKMKHPLLLIHGEADNNSGTYPMQSERYFNALKGLGATTRLVMLPKESHGYSAKESIMHLLWEQDQWLEKYVKNK